jgi:hypothetical protein
MTDTLEDRRAATADPSRMLWTTIGIGGIWAAVPLPIWIGLAGAVANVFRSGPEGG